MKVITTAFLFMAVVTVTFAQKVTDDSAVYSPMPGSSKIRKSTSYSGDKEKDNGSPKAFFISLQSGYMFGCRGCDGDNAPSSSFSVINGVKLGSKGRVGLGVGYDSYWRYQTLPLFGAISWDLLGNRNTNAWVVQLNYGYSWAWNQKTFQGYGYDQTDGGRMLSPQIGYRIKYHDVNIALLAGAKMQRAFTYYKYPTWTWMAGVYKENYNSYTVKQDISRFMITLMIGWR